MSTLPISQSDTFRDISGGVVDHGPYTLTANQQFTVTVTPDPDVKQNLTAEIWNESKTTKLSIAASSGTSTCTFTTSAPITLYARSYANLPGSNFSMTVTRSTLPDRRPSESVPTSSIAWITTPSPHDPNDPASSLWNYNGYTYYVWIDEKLRPTVDKRQDGALIEQAPIDLNGYTVNPDAHGRFSLGIDQQGYLHVIGDMHNYTGYLGDSTHPLYKNKQVLYWRSKAPESVSKGFLFAGERPKDPKLNPSTTLNAEGWISACARFFTDNQGELYYSSSVHAIVTGQSGKVGVGLFKYNVKDQTWTTIGGLPDRNIDPPAIRFPVFFWEVGGFGGGSNWFQNLQPYFCFDAKNTLHFTVSINTDCKTDGANCVVYACSLDGGVTWKRADGSLISGFPLRASDGQANRASIVASDPAKEKDGYFGPSVAVIADRNSVPGVQANGIWRTWNGSQWVTPFNAALGRFAYLHSNGDLVFINGMDINTAKSFSDLDKKLPTYTLPASIGQGRGQFNIDSFGLRRTGELYSVTYNSNTKQHSILKTVLRP